MGDRRRDVAPVGSGTAPGGPLSGLADLFGGESDRSRRFLGGLIAGAMVGAAIAGLVRGRRGPADGPGDHAR